MGLPLQLSQDRKELRANVVCWLLLKLFYLQCEQNPFSALCSMVFYRSVTYYVAPYQPQSISVFHIPNSLLHESTTVYRSAFISFCVKQDFSTNFDVYVIGVFNIYIGLPFRLETVVTTEFHYISPAWD